MKKTKKATDIDDDNGLDEHARWVMEIQLYEKEAERWEEKSKKILKRYKDERSVHDESRARYNILWSNIQTLLPALYGRNPQPDIERRHKQHDDLGRVTADILERTVAFFVATEQFGRVMRAAVLDRLLCGRGTVWVRYMPHFRDATVSGDEEVKAEGPEITDDAYSEEDEEESVQEVYYEEICFDYVHWQDFGHTIARTPDEVKAYWRKSYLDRDELVERFGEEVGNAIPLDYTPRGLNDEKVSNDMKKATIYEIWSLGDKTARWLHKNYPKLLDKREDPLGLKEFYPCPIPLLATTANDSMIPVPDYIEYQDQAQEMDQTTARISSIIKALKVAGVYDASAEGVQRLLSEGVENQLIPVDQWAVHADKGGLKGVMELMPMMEIAQTLLSLYEAREKIKSDLYEITGIADIIRGDSNPNETATAQQLKGQYATLRLSAMQDQVQAFARDLVRIAAQIIAKHFNIDTIKNICGVSLLTQQEKAMLMQQQQMAQQSGQPIPPPSEEIQEMLENPVWEEVEQLLHDDAMLGFKIDIETDSTLKQDQDNEKQSRIELLQAISSFMQQAQTIQDPTLKVLMAELLGFGIRAFRAGKQIEAAVQLAISKIEKEAQNPQPQQNPEAIKAQTQLQVAQIKAQSDQQRAQNDMTLEQQKMQMQAQNEQRQKEMEVQVDLAKHQQEIQLKREEIQADMVKDKYRTDASVAQASAEGEGSESDAPPADAEDVSIPPEMDMKQLLHAVHAHLQAIHEHNMTPKVVTVTRDMHGNLYGEVKPGRRQ